MARLPKKFLKENEEYIQSILEEMHRRNPEGKLNALGEAWVRGEKSPLYEYREIFYAGLKKSERGDWE